MSSEISKIVKSEGKAILDVRNVAGGCGHGGSSKQKNIPKRIILWRVKWSINDNIQRNEATGFGVKVLEDNTYCMGYFENDVMNGSCVYVLADGSYFRGKMVNGVADDEHGFYKDA